jgi:hypothetical protein
MYSFVDNLVYVTRSHNGVDITELFDKLYHTEITYNGTIITATVKDYLGNINTAHNETVHFMINAEERQSTSVNGVAIIAYAGPENVKVTTNQPDMRNGELIIGTLPAPVDRVDLLAADNVALKQQNEEINAQIIDLFEQLIDKGVL